MNISYVTYDKSGALTGCYLQEMQLEHEPNYIVVSEEARACWPLYRANTTRDGVELIPFVAEPAPVPQVVPMRSARRALYLAGLLATVEGIINAMAGEAGDLARIDWATAATVRRTDPVVAQIIPSLGKTEAEIDAMFIAAAAM